MRLLYTRTGELQWFNEGEVPKYAILSHVWDKYEQTLQEVENLDRRPRTFDADSLFRTVPPGLSEKLRGACKFALDLGYDWIWMDTCCIDKTSSAELSEAINSMFTFYSNAAVCIAYLADVPDDDSDPTAEDSAFWRSNWFNRGWTLQELVAPKDVVFVSKGWKEFGRKSGLAKTVEEITGIDESVLTMRIELSSVCIAERMRWAADRVTTRREDRAYSLLGIFDVHIPPLYGEGDRAFRRLQEELLRSSPDQTLFAWGFPSTPLPDMPPGLLADSPSRFMSEGMEGTCALSIEEIPMAAEAFLSAITSTASKRSPNVCGLPTDGIMSLPLDTPSSSITNYGIRIRIPLLHRPSGRCAIAILAVWHDSSYVGLVLRRLSEGASTHYVVGMQGYRLVLADADQDGQSPDSWATELDLAHEDTVIQWEDIYVTSTEPWLAQIRPAVMDAPLQTLSGIPPSDRGHFRTSRHHAIVTRRCLSLMNSSLVQDICGIVDPSLRNDRVPDLASRIAENIPAELRQACTLWITHLPLSAPEPDLLEALLVFSGGHLLHWIEALGLLGRLRTGIVGLPTTFDWFSKHDPRTERLMRDANYLIRAYNVTLSISTLQLYHRVLTFEMPDCDLYQRAMEVSAPSIKVLSPRRRGWASIPEELENTSDSKFTSVVFMPDNIHVITASTDGRLRMWNSRTLARAATFRERRKHTCAIACSPDGRLVASCGNPGGVAVWDVGKRTLLWTPEEDCDSGYPVVAFSSDSSLIAAGSCDGIVCVWSAGTGDRVCEMLGPRPGVNAVAFSPHGASLASGSDDNLKIWSIPSGKAIHDIQCWASSVAFSPDGLYVASGGWLCTVNIWNAATGERVHALQGPMDHITFVAFASLGSHLVVCSEYGTISKWDASTGKHISTFVSGGRRLTSRIAISPDERQLASISATGAFVKVWDANTIFTKPVGHEDSVSAVTFAPNGEIFATSSHDKTVRLWNTDTAESFRTIAHTSEVYAVHFSPDGTILAIGSRGESIALFDTDTWNEAEPLTRPPEGNPYGFHSIAFTADSSRLAASAMDSVFVWDISSRECISKLEGSSTIRTLIFSPDMTRIATGEDSGHPCVQVWDIPTAQRVAKLRGLQHRIYSLAFSSDGGHLISRGDDGSVWVGSIPSPAMRDDSPMGADQAPLRFMWPREWAQGVGWLHLAAGVGQEPKRVCWFPEERRPDSGGRCYAWHGNVVVVGSENGVVTVVDVTEALRSL